MIQPFPIKTPVLEGSLIGYIWAQWLTAVRAALNLIPGNSLPVTFANLPQTPAEGLLIVVTDASVNTWGSVVAGGGTHRVLAYFNGVHWTVAAA